MTNAERITEKIKKLLELATSPNEHEARRAMEMAQKLMIQFNISEALLTDSISSEAIEEIDYSNEHFNRLGVREQLPRIVKTIGRIFGCFGLYDRRGTGVIAKVKLYGYPTNLKIAQYALDSIFAQGFIEYKAAYKKHRSAMIGLEFWDGYAFGLQRKFDQFASRESNNALAIYDPVAQYAKDRSAGTFSLSNFEGDARSAGIEAGMRAEIRSAITSSSKGSLLK
jgi:hypothetical protein